MGIIQRQSIKNSIVNFLGVFIGGISVLFIYSLDDDIYGYAQFLYGTAMLLIPFASAGALTLLIKFYPEFNKGTKGDNGFLSLILILVFIFFAIFSVLAFTFKGQIYAWLGRLNFPNLELVVDNEFWIWALSFVLILLTLFYNNCSNFGRIVVPDILRNLGYKIFLPVLVLIYYFTSLAREQFAAGILIFFIVVLILLVIYTASMGQLNLSWNPAFITKERGKRMFSFMTFSGLNNLGGMLAFRLDSIMISTMIGTASNGLYFKILFIANVIDIPALAIHQISAPIISKAWNESDLEEIQMIYRKSSINLLISGFLIFLVCWFSLDHLFNISVNPDSFENGKLIFLFLAIGKIFNMATSVNNPIISYSNLYKYNLIFILVLGVSNVLLNYNLIGEFEVVGAAMATCFALMIFNIVKFLFILIKFKMHPFSKSTIYILLIFALVFGLFYVIPQSSNHLLMIAFYVTTIPLIYGTIIYKTKVSPDLNEMTRDYYNDAVNRFRKK